MKKKGQLYIPGYVSERVRNCINDLEWASYTDDCINDAWRELKEFMPGEETQLQYTGKSVM